MLNFLALISKFMFSNFGLSIIALTIIVRALMLPLTMRQLKTTKAMKQLQPKLKEMQKKYAKDKQRLAQETMKLYKEQGVSPLGGCLPMLVQLPIWFALYQTIIQALSATPEGLLGLSQRLYSWQTVQQAVPLGSGFLWLDLARPDIFISIIVAVSMWVLQKMSTMPSIDPRQESMTRMMVWIMPLMFGFFALSFPSGLSLYWMFSNILSIVLQYYVTGWGTLHIPSTWRERLPWPKPYSPAPVPIANEEA